ncbi:hypothetical protein BLOT_005024 [Blomia tropicalis]|nr:hypothetical protein BLOT_005024 [Blomia tropicalis]
MAEFQAIIDFSFQINKFINIDLFRRGLYQIRLNLRLPNCKRPHKIEIINSNLGTALSSITTSESCSSLNELSTTRSSNSTTSASASSNIISPPSVINGAVVSKTFLIVYKNEEALLNDNASFRVNICLDANECLKQLRKTCFLLQIELWFTDQETMPSLLTTMECVSTRNLQIHFDLCRGIHYNLPVIFDYFHLSGITLSIHGSLNTLCQPYIYKNEQSSLWLSNIGKCETKDEKRSSQCHSAAENGDRKMQQYLLQIRRLHLTQWRLISIIISSWLSLRRKINEYFRLLPPWQQAKFKFDNLFVDISMNRISRLSQECYKLLDVNDQSTNLSNIFITFQNNSLKQYLQTTKPYDNNIKVEDLLATIEHDISYFCALTTKQWEHFLAMVSNSDRINQHLAKIHHLQRIKRFSEGFFSIEQPRSNLNAICDQSTSLFSEMSDLIRKSHYFATLPPCEVECTYLDGDSTTLPIIYERKYETIPLPDDNQVEVATNLADSQSTNENLNAIDFLGIYRNDLFQEVETNNIEQVNRRIKLLSNFLNKKDIIKSYSKIKLEYSDKSLKKLAKANQSTIVEMLRNTITSQPIQSNQSFSQIKLIDADSLENSRSWPNLTENVPNGRKHKNGLHQRSASVQSSVPSNINRNKLYHIKKNKSFKSGKRSKSISFDDHNLVDTPLYSISTNYANFKGTMYFPKPPKEFAMEEIDEIAEEINLKPIPNDLDSTNCINGKIQKTSNNNNNSVPIETVKLKDLNLDETLLKAIDNLKLKNSNSCQDLTTMETKSISETLTNGTSISHSKDDNFLKNNHIGDGSKLTFVELLRSGHCLICSGSIKNRLDQSWPCMCNANFHSNKQSSSSSHENNGTTTKMDNTKSSTPPTLRRASLIGSDLISFLHAKEEFRGQISKKNKNILFYSDFHTLASRIPYFQCEPDFRIFNSHKDLHLIVCVHGLDGNSADLRLVRTYLELGLPTNNFEFLMSQRNQGETFDSLETLTSRLVNEIDNHVSTFNLKPTRISFIGHSLGNIIIRAAISRHDFIRRWRDKLHTFLSLSGPHLGLSYNRSGLVNMGLWFFQKFRKATSLNQLSMKDSVNIRQTFLYQLSTKAGLEHFRNVILCGSSQDFYVPIHSAHIELCNAALSDSSENGIAYREMANNILERLKNKTNVNIVRYDVHHALASNANSLIGRAAHIAVLDSELFIEKFLAVVGLNYFV